MGLSLTRKHGQSVIILTPNGDQIEITAYNNPGTGRNVQLVFDAPETYSIYRAELLKKNHYALPEEKRSV